MATKAIEGIVIGGEEYVRVGDLAVALGVTNETVLDRCVRRDLPVFADPSDGRKRVILGEDAKKLARPNRVGRGYRERVAKHRVF